MCKRLALALALTSAACASAPPSPQSPGSHAGAPARPLVEAPRAPAQPSSAWDERRQPAPNLGLAVGPACQQNPDCAKYVSECTDQPICDGVSCVPMASLGTNCRATADAASGPGICRQRVCEQATARPEVCGEALLNAILRSSGRGFVYGQHCSLPACLDEQRQLFDGMDLEWGKLFVGCMAATDASLIIPIDWSPSAPYASPFPALPGSVPPAPTKPRPGGAP
jgi:hypothetical protein